MISPSYSFNNWLTKFKINIHTPTNMLDLTLGFVGRESKLLVLTIIHEIFLYTHTLIPSPLI